MNQETAKKEYTSLNAVLTDLIGEDVIEAAPVTNDNVATVKLIAVPFHSLSIKQGQ